MGLQIEDGTGSGKTAKVSLNHQVAVRSESVDSSAIVAGRDERYFVWQSDYAASANDIVLYIQNTDPNRLLKIRKIYLYNSGATTWEMQRVDSGTPAGTEIDALNLTFGSGINANATAYGDAAVTGTSGTTAFSYVKDAGDDHYLDANGAVIIKPFSAIQVKVTGAGTIKVYIAAYFADAGI